MDYLLLRRLGELESSLSAMSFASTDAESVANYDQIIDCLRTIKIALVEILVRIGLAEANLMRDCLLQNHGGQAEELGDELEAEQEGISGKELDSSVSTLIAIALQFFATEKGRGNEELTDALLQAQRLILMAQICIWAGKICQRLQTAYPSEARSFEQFVRSVVGQCDFAIGNDMHPRLSIGKPTERGFPKELNPDFELESDSDETSTAELFALFVASSRQISLNIRDIFERSIKS